MSAGFISLLPFYDIDILTCAGEVGGFMGLLLGGSVLTLCEIVDFLFYSAVIRLLEKYKRNKQVGVEGRTQAPT